ncbi:vWA-MoxR associated conflict system protein [Streptomyces griseosporeus]|uniref:vWA-MoxR associated conflict system protein n=1 Tax=Streptomyces griseosporeus TaxID=1910 RepID=UPI0036F97916
MTWEQRRHVLVVGAQCRAMGELARLEEAARGLHAVLTDPALGACAARTGDHPSLLVGAELTTEDVRTALREAVCRARDDNAVLVVALLGHGFTAPQQADLYYMVAESETGSIGSAVHVGQLLTEAVDEPGVEGVVALVDTCHAAGAVPDARGIAGGMRAGRARLSVLTAAAADQAARDMRLTFALVDVLRDGLTGAGPFVYPDARLTEELRGRVVGQVVGRFEYDSDPYAADGLWLARNALPAPGAGGGAVGAVGRADLEEAVTLWRAGTRLPARLTRSALDELHTFARLADVTEGADPLWQDRVTDVVATLLGCCDLVTLLNTVFAEVLNTGLLRTARQLAGLPPSAEGPELLRDLVEYAALRATKVAESPWKAPARLVAALALLAPHGQMDARLREWARRHGVVTEFNDALTELARRREQGELRLVVSLAGALTDWPDEVDAWLVGSGEPLPVHERFRCESADQRGVGLAIGTALNWARRRLPAPEQLVNVDVAAPAHLLACWQPEEDRVGRRRLGVNHTVVVRWSGRMDPMEENAEMNDAARKALRDMAACASVPVEWIGVSVLRDRPRFEQDLETGRYDTAVGLDHHPEALQDVLEQLLPYAPIILWPRPDARFDDVRLRSQVEHHWASLPAGFAEAYRERWAADHTCQACLGDLRAVWHDEVWLEFCRPFEQRIVAGPEEEQ